MKAVKIPCEHDLLSTNDKVLVDAVMRCKHGAGYCGADGYCHADGKCFIDQTLSREQAILEVDLLTQQLYEQKRKIEQLENASRLLISQLEKAVEQNLEKGNTQRVFAIRFCIAEIKRATN